MRNLFFLTLLVNFHINSQTILWQNNFSNSADWISLNYPNGTPPHTSGNWAITTNLTSIPVGALIPAGFTSASNGYALINSDAEGANASQNAMIVTSASINLSTQSNVKINFQQSHRRYAESTYVVYSIDGGIIWNEIAVNAGMTANTNTTNPAIVEVNLSAQIGGQANVKIGFKYTGQYDWFWAIDDVKLINVPINDLTLNNVFIGSVGAWGVKMPYYQIPLSQIAPIEVKGIITNNGFGNQNNVIFSSNVLGAGFSGTSSSSNILSLQTDTLTLNSNFTPTSQVANLTFNSTVNGNVPEINLNDNSFSGPSININNTIYARDLGVNSNGFNLSSASEIGNIFDIFNQTSIEGIEFFVDPTSIIGTQVYVKLYSVDLLSGNFVVVQTSLPHTLTNADLGQMIFLPFNSSIILNANQSYFIVAGSSANGLVIGVSGNSGDQTSFYYNLIWYQTPFTPMVRMVLCNPPSASQLSTLQSNNLCYGNNFNCQVSVNGGCQPYTVVLSDGINQFTQIGNSPLNFNVTPTNSCNYSIVSVIDNNGGTCLANNGTIIVNVTHPNDSIYANGPTNFCSGLNTTLIAQNTLGNTFQWYKNGVSIPGANSFFYVTNNNPSGIYYLISTIGNCSLTSNIITVSTYSNNYQTFDTICGGPYLWNNQTYNTSGNYTQTFQAQNGCDSIVTLQLVIHPNIFNPTFSSTQQLFTSPPFAVQFTNSTVNPANYNFTWYWGDGTSTSSNNLSVFHQYLNNGLYTITLDATNITTGCTDQTTLIDYIFTTGGVGCTHSATINQTGPIVSCSGQSVILSCNSNSTFTYQWVKNGVYISGNNNDTLIVTQPGSYSVIISENGCPVSSGQVSVSFSSITIPVVTSSGSIQPCIGGAVTLNAPAGFTSYLWNNGATTQSTIVNSSGNYIVQVTNLNGCQATSIPYTINASILPSQNICVVGVDSLTNNIRVVWEELNTTAIDSFYIYKESNVTNVYTQVGSRSYDSLSVWIDPISNPAVQSYRYKITALDTCGAQTPLSGFHKTIHLTINQGVGGAWNLIWSHYEGINFGSYNIYRGTAPNSMVLLTSIQSNLNSYTDLTAPVGNIYYQIEIINPNICTPSKSTNYSSSKSNVVTNNSIGINEVNNTLFKVFPNPANKEINILTDSRNVGSPFELIDFTGRKVLSGKIESENSRINIEGISTGNYLLNIGIGSHIKIVIE
jgi:hypothetical protein